ncbi:MAG: tetraacyldisaccharide 4'-kinase [Endomicrobium sp.]|jgi:tetraacyldisaccharide 4'-kinase|nr:tetraacyldisaccharide 4'-kinase [Endomicrobium sp.]
MLKFLKVALYPVSLIYAVLLKADRKLTVAKKLPKCVISVGNITWGGTGKTPIVIELLDFLTEKNLKSVVLTRGYLRKTKHPIVLRNGAAGVCSMASGDEPLLIAKSAPKAVVVVGADRYNNALTFGAEAKPDVYVLDDGFQHWKIKRNLDMVCVNAANPFGNGMLIPLGILRESPKSLKRADVIVVTNCDMVSKAGINNLKKKLFELSGKDPILACYGDFKYKTVDLNADFDVSLLKSNEVYSLSAIGFAQGFKNSIEKSGVTLKGSVILRDHSQYSDSKLNELIAQKKANAYFIITAKDAVKLQNVDSKIKEKIAVLTVKPQFITGKEQWEQTILKRLRFF